VSTSLRRVPRAIRKPWPCTATQADTHTATGDTVADGLGLYARYTGYGAPSLSLSPLEPAPDKGEQNAVGHTRLAHAHGDDFVLSLCACAWRRHKTRGLHSKGPQCRSNNREMLGTHSTGGMWRIPSAGQLREATRGASARAPPHRAHGSKQIVGCQWRAPHTPCRAPLAPPRSPRRPLPLGQTRASARVRTRCPALRSCPLSRRLPRPARHHPGTSIPRTAARPNSALLLPLSCGSRDHVHCRLGRARPAPCGSAARLPSQLMVSLWCPAE